MNFLNYQFSKLYLPGVINIFQIYLISNSDNMKIFYILNTINKYKLFIGGNLNHYFKLHTNYYYYFFFALAMNQDIFAA